MISKKINDLIKKREFVSVATSDFEGRPNVAPKFILKIKDNFIYFADHVLGTTYDNLKLNPRVSISIMDLDVLTGYQINGSVEIVEKGKDFEEMINELKEREINLSVQRIIEGIDKGKSHESFEVMLSEKVAILKVKIEETVEISSSGLIKREKYE